VDIPKVTRKLDTILYADVAEYSRLTELDEEGTHQILGAYLDVLTNCIDEHGGRTVHFAGDAVLAEFNGVMDALSAAVEVQRDLEEKNRGLPEDRQVRFRIGINVGEVIVDRDDIYGDGVNVTARLEQMADPAGICISGTVRDAIADRLPLAYEDLGERQVKNINRPVRAYRVLLEWSAPVSPPTRPRKPTGRRIAAALLLTVLAVAAAGVWYLPRWELASPVNTLTGTQPPALPERPSIAVLPFRNLSGDPDQDYFSDGITNDVITDLSKFRELFVIASNTSFSYKGQLVDVQTIGRDLGVRYVLQGTVQKAGAWVRINAQLINAATGRHLWAERYDRDMADLFAMQDEIVQSIVASLAVRIDLTERERAQRKDTRDLVAYDYLLRGKEQRAQATRAANLSARELLENAIELDPGYASAHAELGWCHYDAQTYGWTEFPDQALRRAEELARKAVALDDSNIAAHRLLGSTFLKRGQFELAMDELERALSLNPNDAEAYAGLGMVALYSGRPGDAAQAFEAAIRFNPAMAPTEFINLGFAYYLLERYDDAIAVLERGRNRYPDTVFIHLGLAAAYARVDRPLEAAESAEAVRRGAPFFDLDSFGTIFRNEADRRRIVEGLRLAGL